MPRIVGYLRPDIDGKNVQSQLDLLKANGAGKVVQEKLLGTNRDRPQLDKLLSDVQAGDTVVVTSLDRIAHNSKSLLVFVESLNAAGTSRGNAAFASRCNYRL
jgi:DNA invertase Pin-like site-specific DNA recombinase